MCVFFFFNLEEMVSKLVNVGIEKGEKDQVGRLSNVLKIPPNENLVCRWVQVPQDRRC